MTDPEFHGAVLIVDSISSLIAEKELDGDFSPTRLDCLRSCLSLPRRWDKSYPTKEDW